MSSMGTRLERFDRWQQQRRRPAIGLATLKKFQEDQTTNLAGLVAFWAFFSVFPLLLVLVTLLGYFDASQSVMNNIRQMLPILEEQKPSALNGNALALVVGIVSAMWSGMAVVRTAQYAFNTIWEVPMNERPKLVEQTVRSLKVLAVVGVGLVLSTVVTGFLTSTANDILPAVASSIIGPAIALALDIGLFVAAFRLLTDRAITTKQVLPGALLAGVVFWALQLASTLIIGRYLQNAQATYAAMATAITMLWWFYLQAIVTLLGVQLNVVLAHRLWPRSLVGGPATRADHEAYDAYAKERTYHDNEEVDTTFRPEAPEVPEGPAGTDETAGQQRN
ncbi:MAG: YihY/virulence factor BrkB family protein [Frankiaceae bacterium]